MIRPTKSLHPEAVDFVPQAILNRSITEFSRRFPDYVQEGWDDLDRYEGVCFVRNDDLPFAVLHYRGHSPDSSTLYIDGRVQDVGEITELVTAIVQDLDLPLDAIEWQRRDNPDL